VDLAETFDGCVADIDEGLDMAQSSDLQVLLAHERGPIRRGTLPVVTADSCSSHEAISVWRQLSAHGSAERRNSSHSLGNSTPPQSTAASVQLHDHVSGGISSSSTVDTPPKLRSHEKGALPSRTLGNQEHHFATLKLFLSSPEAGKFIESHKLSTMKEEIVSAQVREAYWSTLSCDEGSERSLQMQGHAQPQAEVPESSSTMVPLTPLGGSSWGFCDRTSTTSLHGGKWALWTYVGPCLHRHDFASEHEARAAMCTRNVLPRAGPCLLRDPSGKELDAISWRTSCA